MFSTFEFCKRVCLYRNGYIESPLSYKLIPGVDQSLQPQELQELKFLRRGNFEPPKPTLENWHWKVHWTNVCCSHSRPSPQSEESVAKRKTHCTRGSSTSVYCMAFPGIETPMSNMTKPSNSCSELIQSIQAYLKDTNILKLQQYWNLKSTQFGGFQRWIAF